jgi:type IV pilus assembly protein PilM
VTSVIDSIKNMFALESDLHVGLDLGASAIKLLAVKGNTSSRPKIVAAAIVETPLGCVQDGNLSDGRTLSEMIVKAFGMANIPLKGTKVNVGLRGLNVVHKKIQLPSAKPEEMAQQVILEAQQQVDSDLNDWIIDHQVISKPDAQGQVQVMLVAAKRHGVLEFRNLLTSLQLKPVVFDCDVFAVENAFENSYGLSDEICLCLDIGRDSTKINMVQNGSPLLVRSFGLGGSHFTEQISKFLSLGYDHAESLKVSSGSNPEKLESKEFDQALDAHCSELVEEIRRTLEFFSTQNAGVAIENLDQVLLSGGGSLAATFGQRLQNALKVNVQFLNPFKGVDGNIPDVCAPYPHVFAVSLGLALRSMGDKPP